MNGIVLDAPSLREAIAKDQLFLVYQPQVSADGLRMVSVEALVRYHRPERGLVLPGRGVNGPTGSLILPLRIA